MLSSGAYGLLFHRSGVGVVDGVVMGVTAGVTSCVDAAVQLARPASADIRPGLWLLNICANEIP